MDASLAATASRQPGRAAKPSYQCPISEKCASGNPKRIERYFLRKWAYRLFGRFMGKTINRI